MARRRYADAGTSRLAVWARRCAFFSLVATLLAIIIVRTGLLEIVPAMAMTANHLSCCRMRCWTNMAGDAINGSKCVNDPNKPARDRIPPPVLLEGFCERHSSFQAQVFVALIRMSGNELGERGVVGLKMKDLFGPLISQSEDEPLVNLTT